jgi:2-polyprenyl-3-methyl-5-hydroxy-6-metoxy-1,4-benzoquinol methylase
MNQDKCWDYYQNEGIDAFDQSHARLRYLVKLLHAVLRPGRATRLRILNVGVGNGVFEELCVKAGHEVWSLDPSERTVHQLEQKLNVRAIVGTVEDATLPSDSFSVITMSEVLEHLPDSGLERAVRNVRRMLNSSGVLIGTVPHQERLQDNMVVCPHCGERFHRWGHHQSFTPQRLTEVLANQFPTVKIWIRPFIAWDKLNWKGRLLGALQHLLAVAGIHGGNETIVFYAKKT